jgi:hypothetical protein
MPEEPGRNLEAGESTLKLNQRDVERVRTDVAGGQSISVDVPKGEIDGFMEQLIEGLEASMEVDDPYLKNKGRGMPKIRIIDPRRDDFDEKVAELERICKEWGPRSPWDYRAAFNELNIFINPDALGLGQEDEVFKRALRRIAKLGQNLYVFDHKAEPSEMSDHLIEAIGGHGHGHIEVRRELNLNPKQLRSILFGLFEADGKLSIKVPEGGKMDYFVEEIMRAIYAESHSRDPEGEQPRLSVRTIEPKGYALRDHLDDLRRNKEQFGHLPYSEYAEQVNEVVIFKNPDLLELTEHEDMSAILNAAKKGKVIFVFDHEFLEKYGGLPGYLQLAIRLTSSYQLDEAV